MDLGVHEIDILRYLVGAPVESVFALGGRKIHAAFEDHANILLRFQNGVHGFVEVNWLTPMKVRRLALTCLKNFVEVDYTEQSVTVSSSTLGPLDPFNLYQIPLEHHTQKIHVRKEEPLKRELEDFLDAVKHKRPPLVSGEDALETLKVAIAATDSHRTGKLVPLGGAASELSFPDASVHEAHLDDVGTGVEVATVHEREMPHPTAEGLEIEFAIRVVGGDERDAVRALRRGFHVPQDGVPSFRARERIVDRDVGAATSELLDHRFRGRVPRVIRVLAVREAEDGDASPFDLPTRGREGLLDEARHPPRHEVIHFASGRDEFRFRLDRGRHEEPRVLRDAVAADARARDEHHSIGARIDELAHPIGVHTELLADQGHLVRKGDLDVPVCVLRGLHD